MPELNEVMQRLRTTKKERKKVHDIFKEALSQSKRYQDLVEQIKELTTKKRQVEADLRQEFASELEKVERLSQGIKTDAQLLSDMALTKFMKGENIELVDENDVKYEPVIKISYKKSN